MKYLLKRKFYLLLVILVSICSKNYAKAEQNEYQFSWLDPDKKIYVLQNRKYEKAGHSILSLLGGTGSTNAYQSSYHLDGRLSFNFTEELGLEGFYQSLLNKNNSTFDALLASGSNIIPVVRKVKAQYGVLFHYSPWYAKINVYNSILYFDWYFSAGGGLIQTDLEKRINLTAQPTYWRQVIGSGFIGMGQHFFIDEHFMFRLDGTVSIYQAPLFGDSGVNSWYTSWLFGAGFGFRI